ncbi:alpha/beta fold hydrolase [Dermatobacter hominis]|uniref:alpha/beta fold hydrolase n=1 Tax=Dermatobacter hominis TaxID=2884263 RepID=UPI001D120347|nr:alpha/beta fold hydrolase [Dermatobacter hominis]UDY35699.1 alpha/beta fold hydrolase [Dermatobacter hominis]
MATITTTSDDRRLHDAVLGETRFGPFDLRWYESGPSDEPGILLLHGLYAGASGYEWRKLVPELARTHRVRVPDLLGAGGSDRPAIDYTPDVVRRAVEALIDDAGDRVHVVASSLVGAYALQVVADRARRGAGVPLTLVTPTGLGRRQPRPPAPVAELLRRTPVGDVLVHGLTSAPSVRWFQRNRTYDDPEVLTEEEVVVTRRKGRLPGAKHLQLAFVTGELALDIDAADVGLVAPRVVWGTGQDFVDDDERHLWRAAGATVVELASGLPQVEQPERLAEILRERE